MTDIFTKLTELREKVDHRDFANFSIDIHTSGYESEWLIREYVTSLVNAFDTLKAHHEAAERLAARIAGIDTVVICADETNPYEEEISATLEEVIRSRDKALEEYRNAIK